VCKRWQEKQLEMMKNKLSELQTDKNLTELLEAGKRDFDEAQKDYDEKAEAEFAGIIRRN
jgi:hypothetical protein